MGRFVAFMKDETGASAIEYGLLVALVALALAVGLTAMGTSISTGLEGVAGDVTAEFN